MIRFSHVLMVSALLGFFGMALVGCGATGQAVATTAGAASTALPPEILANIRKTCAASDPALALATAPGMPAQISGTAIDLKAYCDQLAALPAGQAPGTTDANTPQWVGQVLGMLKVAAQVAGIVLPLVL